MSQDNIDQLLSQKPEPAKRLSFWVGAAVLFGSTLAFAIWKMENRAGQLRYVTAEAKRGDLTVMVTATGTVKPLNQVEVGTEVSGTIETVLADYNDQVKRGQVLARLDTAQLEAKKRQTEASLALAQARVREAEATLKETRQKFQRAQRLVQTKLISQEALEAAEAALLRAEAALASALAQVAATQAQLDENQRMLEKAVIRAPIDGIVLQRQVEPGQTVAASLQTPVLFVLAETLRQMALHVAVDEADVGQVKEGQTATFTVDAYPDRRFQAVIAQVRYAPQIVDGVVTYETVLAVDNSDLALRPGMTATAEIVVNRIEDALLVPNAALRFSPPPANEPNAESGGVLAKLFPRRSVPKTVSVEAADPHVQRVWIVQDGRLLPVTVRTGISDGNFTQVLAGDISPGTPLAVDVVSSGP